MKAAARIARRELRAAWRRLAPMLLCLTLGVGAVVMVGSFADSVRASIDARTRGLLAADVQLSSSAPVERAVFPSLAQWEAEGAAFAEVTEFLSVLIAPDGETSVLSEVKAVGEAYPLVGSLELTDGTAVAAPVGNDVLVEASLLDRMGVAVGDELRFGETTVRIAGVLGKEPDRSLAGVALGPRVLAPAGILPTSNLLDRGSRATYRLSVRLPEGVRPVEAKELLVREARGTTVRIRTPEDAQSVLRRALDRMEHVLSIVALAILLLGGTGIALTMRLHVLQRLDALAVLRAVGATRGQLLGVVLLQGLALGVLGSAAGVALGVLVSRAFPALVAGLLPDVVAVVSWRAALQGAALGLATAAAFALAPALLAGRVSPLAVLRRTPTPIMLPRRRSELALLGGAAALFTGALVLALGSWLTALALLVGLLVLVAVLQVLARGIIVLLRRAAKHVRRFTLREGLLHPTRTPRTAATVITTLTVGGLLLGAVGLTQQTVLDSVQSALTEGAPNLYLLGVRADQREDVSAALGQTVEFEPIVRARVAAVDGRVVLRNVPRDEQDAPEDTPSGEIRREFGITTRDALGSDERLLQGRMWDTADLPQVSVEEELARDAGIRIGSRVTFDILGSQLETRVTSLRAVDWESGRPNYVFVLSPGALDGAPTTYFAAVRADPERLTALQTAVVRAAPNASVVDATAVLATVRDVLGQVVAVLQLLSLLVLAVGLVLLTGMVLSTRAARVRETAVLKALGARGGQVRRMLLVEYGTLGALSGILAALLAHAVTAVVARQLLELRWQPYLMETLLGIASFALVTMLVGVLAARPVLRAAPLAALRE